jgi:2-aminomuconate deaminase
MSAGSTGSGERTVVVEGAARPLGRYPHARRSGRLVFVSGTSSRRPDDTIEGAEVGPDGVVHLDIERQTRAVLANVAAILDRSGSSMADLVQVTTYLVDMADFDGYTAAYDDVIPSPGPTRTTVAVRQLPHPHLLIEVQAVAELAGVAGR